MVVSVGYGLLANSALADDGDVTGGSKGTVAIAESD
jgi:hypothetical protein